MNLHLSLSQRIAIAFLVGTIVFVLAWASKTPDRCAWSNPSPSYTCGVAVR